MRTYLFGISRLSEKLSAGGYLQEFHIDGLFDNAGEKQGEKKWGLIVEHPFYASDIEIVITVKESYHMTIIHQLLDMGYRKFTAFCMATNGRYKKKEYDYSQYDYEHDRDSLVLLYLEHRSYSNICALMYLKESGYLNCYDFRLKLFSADTKDPDFYYDLIAARYIITEREWNLFHLEEVSADVIQIWHGFPLKAMERMRKEYQETEDSIIVRNWKKFNYILSYGLNYTVFLCSCYSTLQKQYVVTGMPRNDLLFLVNGKENLGKKFPACQEKKIVIYMPTFRLLGDWADGRDDGYLFYWKDFDVEVLQDFCRKWNLFFLFKLHPCDASRVCEWCVESDCMGILTDEMLEDTCMYEYLNAADILITDYSSVYFDYMLLDRPIIFTDNDAASYENNRGFIVEPLDFWRPGSVVHTWNRLKEELKDICKGQDNYREKRQQLMPFVHQHRDACATQRLFDFMKSQREKEKNELN